MQNSASYRFRPPSDLDVKVWRYLDLAKFIDLIESSELYLCRADHLDDPHEGAISRELKTQENTDLPPEISELLTKIRSNIRGITFVNCWHRNDQESYAVWYIYCGTKEGVSVQSTYRKLQNALVKPFKIGQVKYGSASASSSDLIGPYMRKREAFAFEQEVRILSSGAVIARRTRVPNRLSINLTDVIEGIRIHPKASALYERTVKSLLSKYRPELLDKLVTSNLKAPPTF